MWHHDVTNAARASFSAVCLTVFPFEFRPRTFTIGFYRKSSIISELMILECSFPLIKQIKSNQIWDDDRSLSGITTWTFSKECKMASTATLQVQVHEAGGLQRRQAGTAFAFKYNIGQRLRLCGTKTSVMVVERHLPASSHHDSSLVNREEEVTTCTIRRCDSVCPEYFVKTSKNEFFKVSEGRLCY